MVMGKSGWKVTSVNKRLRDDRKIVSQIDSEIPKIPFKPMVASKIAMTIINRNGHHMLAAINGFEFFQKWFSSKDFSSCKFLELFFAIAVYRVIFQSFFPQ